MNSIAFSRRKFLAFAGSAAAVAGASRIPASANAENKTFVAYFLDPEWGAEDPECPDPHAGTRSCHACNACHNHALNKMFASEEAADSTRAHAGCYCLVRSAAIGGGEYLQLFGPPGSPGHRDEFDRRRDEFAFVVANFGPFASRDE